MEYPTNKVFGRILLLTCGSAILAGSLTFLALKLGTPSSPPKPKSTVRVIVGEVVRMDCGPDIHDYSRVIDPETGDTIYMRNGHTIIVPKGARVAVTTNGGSD